ncbi:potassium/sodium eff [Auricularia subglabra TFB-10046 SS5]|nr:potassium/sodium eff [Auricularia subglabra TFB-10046 SS5]
MVKSPAAATDNNATADAKGNKPRHPGPTRAAPHVLAADDVVHDLGSDAHNGISFERAAQLLASHGPNELEGGGGVPVWKVLLKQVANAMTIVLLLAMSLSFGVEDFVEGGVILAIIVLNITIGFFQEYRAEKTMESLRNMSSPTATVVRAGQIEQVPNSTVVPGDIVELEDGDIVPADIRLIDTVNFQTDEMLLTGESMPVIKDADEVLPAEDVPLGDRINMAYASSTVVKGRARGVVVYTGMKTAVGEIAGSINGKTVKPGRSLDPRDGGILQPIKGILWRTWDVVANILGITGGTPLQMKLSKLAFVLLCCAVVLAIVVFGVNEFHLSHEVVLYAIALGIGTIPESLIAVLTITMAVGMKTMVKRKVIVRKLDALEALGGIDSICSDKTGTLTQGKMITRRVWLPGVGTYTVERYGAAADPSKGRVTFEEDEEDPYKDGLKVPGGTGSPAGGSTTTSLTHEDTNTTPLPVEVPSVIPAEAHTFLRAVALCNTATLQYDKEDAQFETDGDPTEIALQVFAHRFGSAKSHLRDAGWAQVAEYPFDSDIKRMSVLFEDPETKRVHVFAKGAVERVLNVCSMYGQADSAHAMTEHDKAHIHDRMNALANEGLRLLAVAHRVLEGDAAAWDERDRAEVEKDWTFIGLAAIYDPPRPETRAAVEECKRAGITVHMLTGDHPSTAAAIAREVGIIPKRLAPAEKENLVRSAKQFDAMTDEEIDKLPALPLVIARCAPKTKVKMINALHRRGKYCAMTGDGVNDSPSLKQADVGIAMGEGGSDVAKSASDIVLTDDNFASIVAAIEEGRRMFDNIQKFILHLMVGNVSEGILLVVGLAFRDRNDVSVFPLAPLQILWINLITGFPAFGLGLEKAQADIMIRPAQSTERGMFSWEIITDMLLYGTFVASICFATFVGIVYGHGRGELGANCNGEYNPSCDAVFRARGAIFVELTWLLLVFAWEVKSIRRSLFRLDPGAGARFTFFRDVWANRFLFFAVVLGMLTVFPAIEIPTLNTKVFRHKSITWEWAIAVASVPTFIAMCELWKMVKRRFGLFEVRRNVPKDAPAPKGVENGHQKV